jgi:hypothetical protein
VGILEHGEWVATIAGAGICREVRDSDETGAGHTAAGDDVLDRQLNVGVRGVAVQVDAVGERGGGTLDR